MKIEKLGNDWQRITMYSQEDMDEARKSFPHLKAYGYPEGSVSMSFYGKQGKVLEKSVSFITRTPKEV